MIDPRVEDWRDFADLPWTEYKHLERDKFEELLDLMMEAYPEHELTRWLMRGFCINDGDATLALGSLTGRRVLNHHLQHFDQEDADCFEAFYGDDDDTEWDWDDEDE